MVKKKKMVYQLVHPANYLIAGSTGAGKTEFTIKLLQNFHKLCKTPIKKIFWCYSEANAKPANLKTKIPITYVKGIPDNNIIQNKSNEAIIIVVDDLMHESLGNINISNLFTKYARHNNISVLLLSQNIFFSAKFSRNISLNSKYIVIFRNPRDAGQIWHLARQIEPENPKKLVSAYKRATQKAYTYIFIDLNQTTPELFKYRVDLFKNYTTVFCENPEKRPDLYDETVAGKYSSIKCA